MPGNLLTIPSVVVFLLTLSTVGQTIDLTQGERRQVQLDDRKRLSLEKTLAGYKDQGQPTSGSWSTSTCAV